MIIFTKAATWQCQKCNQTLAVKFASDTPETDVFKQLLELHKKASLDCSAPSGFKLVAMFLKHEEVK